MSAWLRFGRVPRALKVSPEFRRCADVSNHDKVIVPCALAARAEIGRTRAQHRTVDRIGL
jgi:hypothetical protein